MKKLILLISLMISSILYATDAPRILIKIPTRSRPEQFFKQLDLYYKKLSGKIPCAFLITCDNDDTSMNNVKVINKLKTYTNLYVGFGKSCSKIEAYNRDIENYDFDILALASDDMEPIIQGYDLIIAQRMTEAFPDFDGVLHFSDGSDHLDCNTLPIIGKKFIDSIGYAYFPGYKSFCCDNEVTLVSRMLHKELICPEIIIKHNHPMWTGGRWDQLYLKNYQDLEPDKKIFWSRRAHFFGIPLEQLRTAATKDWSILICTEHGDSQSFNQLYNKLQKQIHESNLDGRIEVVVSRADNSRDSFVKRKNLLLAQSKGYYINFIEDYADIADNYISVMYNKMKADTDIIMLRTKKKNSSTRYNAHTDDKNNHWHIPTSNNTMKRHVAVLFKFRNENDEADRSKDLMNSGLIKSEVTIEEPLLFV